MVSLVFSVRRPTKLLIMVHVVLEPLDLGTFLDQERSGKISMNI
jgi:hypothetical protein